ncbi:MAG: hypothetical protein Fur0018_08360 [Anaerolineales bacterium]
MCAHQQDFARLNTRVLIVSFGTLPAVQEWMRETCADFTVLLDREREVYRAYGLERSYWRSRSLKTRLVYFKKAWLSGQKTHASHGDDTSQLGGDFILDASGQLCYAYRSHDPTDRPPVQVLLERLQTL